MILEWFLEQFLAGFLIPLKVAAVFLGGLVVLGIVCVLLWIALESLVTLLVVKFVDWMTRARRKALRCIHDQQQRQARMRPEPPLIRTGRGRRKWKETR